ncbi:unnamed protein product [Acanthoscelides obtectus]|uniref:MADF domain-containing protein n=1 Tax=Acanthoscelides obtectus TaxID=200917 RepID=A0A9P0PPI1_ACAOB|nr:unnamed protein product [Acanthoscelides obtectus]CAK1666162.1 hypothetical protein AOBTE_LOCUS25183 [Acanthoscelides obtectus]
MSFDTEKFIIEIQNRPCLWDSSSNDYCDRNLKIKGWDEIVNIFKEKDEMTNQEKKQLADTLQKRWKSIRGCFTRELNRQKSLKSGSGRGPRKSEYIFFKQLLFLQKVVALRESEVEEKSKESDPDVEATNPDTEQDLQQGSQALSCPKRMKTKKNNAPEDDKFLEALNKSIKSREQYEVENQDEDRLFMLSLVSTLKNVPPQKKMATKMKIMSILDEATRPVLNIDYSTLYRQNYWSQTESSSSQSYHPGYSTVPRETQPMINSTEYLSSEPFSAPPSNMTNVSEDSSILDVYD